MPTGIVNYFNMRKGLGFIDQDEGGKRAVVTAAEVAAAGLERLDEGDAVEYRVQKNNGLDLAVGLKLKAPKP